MVNTSGFGRPPRSVNVEIVRELTGADLAQLGADRGVKAPALKRLTDMHHSIARLVAMGEAGYDIALATGYSESRISILKADPSFQELVAQMREEVRTTHLDYHLALEAKFVANSMDIADIIGERIHNPAISDRDLEAYGKLMFDRAGHGPMTKSQTTNLNLDIAGQLAAGRQRGDQLIAAVPAAKAARELTMIPGGQPGGMEPDMEPASGPKQVDFVTVPKEGTD